VLAHLSKRLLAQVLGDAPELFVFHLEGESKGKQNLGLLIRSMLGRSQIVPLGHVEDNLIHNRVEFLMLLKADGSPEQPLFDEARERCQRQLTASLPLKEAKHAPFQRDCAVHVSGWCVGCGLISLAAGKSHQTGLKERHKTSVLVEHDDKRSLRKCHEELGRFCQEEGCCESREHSLRKN